MLREKGKRGRWKFSNALEGKLQGLVLTYRQAQVMSLLFGLEGKQYSQLSEIAREIYPAPGTVGYCQGSVGSVSKFRDGLLEKLKRAYELPENEFLVLCELEPFYVKLSSLYPNKDLLQARITEVSGLKGRGKRIKSTGWSQLPLERQLGSLVLGERDAQLMSALLGLDGKAYRSQREIINDIFFQDQGSNKMLAKEHYRVQDARRNLLPKLERAWSLGSQEYAVLEQFDPFYQRLKEKYGGKSLAELKKAAWLVGHPRYRQVEIDAEGNIQHLHRWVQSAKSPSVVLGDRVVSSAGKVKGFLFQKLQEVPKDKLQKAIEQLLPSAEQELAKWAFGLENTGLSRKEMAEKLEIGYFSLNYPLVRLAAKLCFHLLGIRMEREDDYYGRLGVKYQEDTLEKRKSKERFLRVKETELWEELSQKEKEAVTLYYGLDLPGEQMHSAGEVAEILGITGKRRSGTITQRIRVAKRKLMALQPGLGFPLSETQSGLDNSSLLLRLPRNFFETKLAKLTLTFCQAQVLSEIFFSDRQYSSWTGLARGLGLTYSAVSFHRSRGLKKLEEALALSWLEWGILEEIDPWYQKFREIHPEMSLENLQSLAYRWGRREKKAMVPKSKTEYLGALETYRREIFSIPELSEDAIVALLGRIKQGESEAMFELYLASLRYVLPMAYAQTYSLAGKEKGLDLMDLIQEGNLGLWLACLRMNFNGNGSWIAYVKATARYAMKRAISEATLSHLIHITERQRRQIREFIQASSNLKTELGYEPSVAEISQRIGKTAEQAWDIQEAMRIFYTPTISLNSPISYGRDEEDERDTLADIIPDPQPWEFLEEPVDVDSTDSIVSMFRDYAQTLLNEVLSPTEQYILRLRYGFEDREYFSWPVDKVAKTLTLSEGMVRYIEQEALERLRGDSRVAQRLQALLKVQRIRFSLPIQTSQLGQYEDSGSEEKGAEKFEGEERWENPALRPKESPGIKLLLKDEQSRHLYKQGLIPALSWYQSK